MTRLAICSEIEFQRVLAEMEAKRALMPKPTEMKRMLKELHHAQ